MTKQEEKKCAEFTSYDIPSKQEEIREGIKRLRGDLRSGYLFDNDDYVVDAYLFYLHSQGVVIKVKRELPDSMPALCVVNLVEGRGYPNCMAGYVAVEPLIKEERDGKTK